MSRICFTFKSQNMLKYFFNNVTLLTTIFVIILSADVKAIEEDEYVDEIICKSVTIRSIHDFKQLQNCNVVAGYVRIVEMSFSPKDLEVLMPSKITEISEYLLVYRVYGIDSLQRLFPSLILIRGVELLYDLYALAIVENLDMENIGLVSLLRILKGSVRIESNPILCFIHTVDWMPIMDIEARDYYLHITNNKSPNHCPHCIFDDDTNQSVRQGCWNMLSPQKTKLDYIHAQMCLNNSCLNSCDDGYCRSCASYMSDKGCVRNCLPPKYRLAHKRKCVTNCTQYGLREFGIECVESCPKHYIGSKDGDKLSCTLNCSRDFVIHNIDDLEGLADCTTINGSLTIEIHEMEKPIVEYLEEVFRNLNEITGYLKIINSPQIITFHFFKNLHTIRGLQLLENRYSIYVLNNNYLQELFWGNVAIIKGCIYFHLNPRLCFDKITDLRRNFRECPKITVTDVSEYSNGERVVCGEDIRLSNATVADVNSTAALIEVDLLPSDELLLLVGYVYYYREAPFKNVTKYDGRHGCGKDGWFTDTVLKKQRRHIITGLKPGTQYAYFVNSLTVTDYPYMAEHVSDIHYFTTLPAKPEAVAKLYFVSRSDTELDLYWWPPLIVNGVLEKYILQYDVTNETAPPEILVPNTPYTDVCKCAKHHSESHVPTPHFDKYYNREELLYKDTVLNFIFQKKKTNATRALRNATDPEYEALLYARYRLAMQKLEQEAIDKQELQKESFIIQHPKPVCDQIDFKIPNQTETQCEPLEEFQNSIIIWGFRHFYSVKNLEPEKTYRFSLRACVKGLVNGCGPEKVILGETVSEKVATLLEHVSHK